MIVEIGDNNVEHAFWPGCMRVKVGTSVSFTQCRRHAACCDRLSKGKCRGSSKGFRAWP